MPKNKELEGIGGWLILPFIHLFVYIIIVLIDLVSISEVLQELVLFVLSIDLILLGMYIVTLIFAFQKKRIAKNLFIASYSANIIVALILAFGFGATENLASSILGGVLWVWYFSVSERVKNTFVN